MTNKQKNIILFLEISFLILFIWFTYYGGFLLGDVFDQGWEAGEDGLNFIESAKLFRENGISIFVKSELERQRSLSYIFTIILISILQTLNGSWALQFVGINLSLFFLSYFILKNFIKKISNQQEFFYLNILLIVFYFSNYENYFYVRFILSDCIFTFFVLVFFIKLNSYKKNKFHYFFIALIFTLIFFINPKFIAILFFLIFYQMIKYLIIKNKFIDKKYFGTSIVFTYLIGLFLWSIFFVNFKIINFFEGDIFLEIEKFYLDGTIIYNRIQSEYLINEISSLKVFYLGVLRSLSFFQFWNLNWDLKHNLVNLISISPLYLGNVLNIYYFNTYSKLSKKIVMSITAMVIAFSFMSSVTAVDYDWRYRYPLYTILMIGLIIFFKEKKIKFLRF